jgi:hypothetical protein
MRLLWCQGGFLMLIQGHGDLIPALPKCGFFKIIPMQSLPVYRLLVFLKIYSKKQLLSVYQEQNWEPILFLTRIKKITAL